MAAGIAAPRRELSAVMRTSIDRDDARGVDHLVVDQYVVARLHNLHVLVVTNRDHRRAGVVAEEAAFRSITIFRAISQSPQLRAARVRTFLSVRKERRQPSIGRIGDERGASIADDLRSELVPELVVSAHLSRRQWRIVDALSVCGLLLFEGGGLLIGQDSLVPQARWPLERRGGGEIKGALEIGMTVGGSRRRPFLAGRHLRSLSLEGSRGGRQHDGERQTERAGT